MYTEYLGANRLHDDVRSIKRAQWSYVIVFTTATIVVLAIAMVTGAQLKDQFDDLTRTVGAPTRSSKELIAFIVAGTRAGRKESKKMSLVTRRMQSINLHISLLPRDERIDADLAVNVPASLEYETYLNALHRLNHRPYMHNVFLFSGEHGLGKTYAAYQMGQALSRFSNVILFSTPMNLFMRTADFNTVGDLLQNVDSALKADKTISAYTIVWLFDELDTYILGDTGMYNDKDITQFAESTGFIDSGERVLAFTMNNDVIFRHDYWTDREKILNASSEYEHRDDAVAAAKLLRLSMENFLMDGQYSRLYSFVGNKNFRFEPFDSETAVKFLRKYIEQKSYTRNTINLDDEQTLQKLFGDDNEFTARDLIIRLDDLLNENNSTRVDVK
ncbi:AAA-like protein [Alphabaculovirus altermyunipunctae]|uniref:AAA-like protein n=1 Tax=Mythimna unipuncta nucleopolyhedrovirus TaxID=447897 RepID=A0A346TPS3_9ABAC|nr:AAA-like protein [Mythimna unipuncta nucleopolyhedrovirus]AXU41583.1 AAA-like protein [Mythimna unipuncta nucleopolyhedrovirus]